MPGNHEWRVAVGTKQRGPYSLEQVRETIAQGRMPADALVWRPGMPEWLPWAEIPELATEASPAARAEPLPVSSAAPQPARRGHPPDDWHHDRPAAAPAPSFMDYVTFRAMITPIVIQILFWLGVAFSVVAGLLMAVGGIGDRDPARIGLGLAVLIIGPLYWRVVAELTIVFFRILDKAREISDKMDRR